MTETSLPVIDPLLYRPVIARALEEDLGLAGDITTASVVAPDARLEARLTTRQAGRIAGLDIALAVFHELEPGMETQVLQAEGADVAADTHLALVSGPARPILTGERTALNILTRLSGIATATRQAVEAVGPYPTRVACTRKTTPGLRSLEKYAVRVGGGVNHRFERFQIGVDIANDEDAHAAGPTRSSSCCSQAPGTRSRPPCPRR